MKIKYLVIALLCAIVNVGFTQVSAPTQPPANGNQPAGGEIISTSYTDDPEICENLVWKGCKKCGEVKTGTGKTQDAAKANCLSQFSGTGSAIDNFTYNHIHDAVDYQSGSTGINGCAPCGSSSPLSGGAIDIGITRIHRFRNMTEPSSLGPGIFFSYDISLSIFEDGLGNPIAEVFDPTNDHKWRVFWDYKNKCFVQNSADYFDYMELLDANYDKVEDWQTATYARLVNLDQSAQIYELFTVDASQRSGRILNFKNTQGYGYDVNYVYSPADTSVTADMLWQKSSIADSNNRQVNFHYLPEQRKGRWVVKQIDLPNGSSLQYNYENAADGALISVDYPDGTQSTFNYVEDTATNTVRIDYFEAGAKSTHRKKSAYLTNNIGSLVDAVQKGGLKLFSQSSLLAQQITNGEGETTWKAYTIGGIHRFIYEGGNKMKYITPLLINYLQDWNVDEDNQRITGYLEPTHTDGLSTVGKSPQLTTDNGSVINFLYTPKGSIRRKQYSDGTLERYTRDIFQNITRHQDRQGRVTYNEYDQTNGNLLKKTVGSQMTTAGAQGLAGVEVSGFNYKYYEADFIETDDFADFTPVTEAHCNHISRNLGDISSNIGFQFTGKLNITSPGDYTFQVIAAKQALLYINGALVVSNTTDLVDGVEQLITLSAGQHDIEFKYMQINGNNRFELSYKGADTLDQYVAVDDEVVTHTVTDMEQIEIQTSDFAEYTYEYYPAGHANQNLLRYEFDANGNRKEYIYNSDNLLIELKEPNDQGTGYHTAKRFTYDSAKRLASSEDAAGRVTSYTYDNRDRQVLTTYNDGSTEQYTYGSGADANLIVQKKDRNNNVTAMEYDAAGRKIQQTVAYGTADAVQSTYSYLLGTSQIQSTVTAGEKTDYSFDYRNRVIATTIYPDADSTLTTSKTIVDNKVFCMTDAYGRSTYNFYRQSDAALVRTVKGLVPTFTLSNYGDVINLTRDLSNNAAYLITDFELNSSAQTIATIDPRGIRHETDYDSRGRVTFNVSAADSLAQTSQTVYDANSNVISSVDPMGNVTNMTYGARNKLATRTVAAGSLVEATESFTYYDDGRADTHTDFRGNQSKTVWHQCCGRLQAGIDQAGHVNVSNNDYYGNVTHTAVVDASGVISNYHDLPDTETVQEVTTQFDSRHRPIARTVWLQPLGEVLPNNVPIANDPALGLTTNYFYFDETAGHPELAPLLAELAADGITFDANNDGSATIVINPEGEVAVSIADGVGRTIASGMYDKDDYALGTYTLVTWSTAVHDTIVNDLLETKTISALDFENKVQSDGAGRRINAIDAENNTATFEYDANSNLVKSRDANGVGQDCDFDNLNRDLSCTDTAGSVTSRVYDLNNRVIESTDAKTKTSYISYDERNRRIDSTDRIDGVTSYTYDDNSNLLTITDALGKVTEYDYDDRNLQIKTTYADNLVGSNPGDTNYGITECSYDALGRKKVSTDQLGDTVTYIYDLAGRMTDREYRTGGAILESTDTFTYDDASRVLTAVKGRYSNTVTCEYDGIGRKKSEATTVGGSTYTTSCTFDADNREINCAYPAGNNVAKTYTDRNQLATVSFAGNNIITSTYDAGMRESTRTLGNGLVTTNTYNLDNTLASRDNAGSAGILPALSYSYTYDSNKNITGETAGGVLSDYSWTAGFDAIDRVTSWNRAGSAGTLPASQSWSLDKIGNWDSVTTDNITENRTHNDAHELTDIAGAALSYDAKGNLTADAYGSVLTWDIDNHMASHGSTTFTYDALGRRLEKKTTSGNTLYISHGQRVIEEYESDGVQPYSLSRSYAYGTYVDDLLAKIEGGGTLYYHTDRQFNVRGLSDSTGAIQELYAYSVYGKQTILDASGILLTATANSNQYGFTGRYLDSETSLWYFRARYFSDEMGRFINRDPLGFVDGFGLYNGYFAEHFGLDPYGLETVTAEKAIKYWWERANRSEYMEYNSSRQTDISYDGKTYPTVQLGELKFTLAADIEETGTNSSGATIRRFGAPVHVGSKGVEKKVLPLSTAKTYVAQTSALKSTIINNGCDECYSVVVRFSAVVGTDIKLNITISAKGVPIAVSFPFNYKKSLVEMDSLYLMKICTDGTSITKKMPGGNVKDAVIGSKTEPYKIKHKKPDGPVMGYIKNFYEWQGLFNNE